MYNNNIWFNFFNNYNILDKNKIIKYNNKNYLMNNKFKSWNH